MFIWEIGGFVSPFFGNKQQKQNTIIGDSWIVAQGKYNGKDIIVRVNAYYKKFKHKDDYKYQVGIATPLTSAEANGLPSAQENLQLQEIEEIIVSDLEQNEKSLFCAAISTNNMKEFIFYTIDPEFVQQRFEHIIGEIQSHKMQISVKVDKPWDVYDWVLSMIKQ